MRPIIHPRAALLLSVAVNVILVIIACLYSTPSLRPGSVIVDSSFLDLDRWIGSGYAGSGGDLGARRDCTPCAVSPELCEEYGEGGLSKAMSFMGSGDRFKRFLLKARRKQGFTVGVIGGSVSKGFGTDRLNGNALYNENNLHKQIFKHLDELFPAANGAVDGISGKLEGKNGFVNGALGATGTDYFCYCYPLHVPEDMDLLITELAINDELLLSNIKTFEYMLRGIMDMPEQPAILNLQITALMFPRIALGGEMHDGVAQYYDLPIVSFRNLVLPSIMEDHQLIAEWFYKRSLTGDINEDIDLRHISIKGHNLTAQLANTYIDTQLCEIERYEAEHGPMTPEDIVLPPLPRLRMWQPYDPDTINPKLEPQCMRANDEQQPLEPISNEGWRPWNWEEKHYLIADVPGSKVTFKVTVGLGTIQLTYLRSAIYGLGTVVCMVDKDPGKRKWINGYWDLTYNIARVETIAEDLTPGEHELTCELSAQTQDPGGGLEFRIISVMAI